MHTGGRRDTNTSRGASGGTRPIAAGGSSRGRRPRRPDDVHLRVRSSNAVVVVPPSAVRHRPDRRAEAGDPALSTTTTASAGSNPAVCPRAPPSPLWLCEVYSQRGLCPAGAACPDVHAVVSAQARRYYPHVRATTPAANTDTAHQPRLGLPGQWHAIAAGNETAATLRVEASQCLRTAVAARLTATSPRVDPPSVCAHFVQKGVCNFGAECRFVHPLSEPMPLADVSTPGPQFNDVGGSVASTTAPFHPLQTGPGYHGATEHSHTSLQLAGSPLVLDQTRVTQVERCTDVAGTAVVNAHDTARATVDSTVSGAYPATFQVSNGGAPGGALPAMPREYYGLRHNPYGTTPGWARVVVTRLSDVSV